MLIKPKNWGDFQHYKDRDPPWIKLHKGLLDNFEYQALPIASKALAPMLWLLASEHKEGVIDAENRKLCFRLRMKPAELEDALRPLIAAGFFELLHDASSPIAQPKQDAMPETEGEEQEEAKDNMPAGAGRVVVPKPNTEGFEEFWKTFDPPKNSKKPDALQAWITTAPKRPPLPDLLRAVAGYNAFLASEWTKNKRQYPAKQHAATWLRGELWGNFSDASAALTPEQIAANMDRADKLFHRGKYAEGQQ